MRFRLVPKSPTLEGLNDLERTLRILFQNSLRACFGASHENLNENRSTLYDPISGEDVYSIS